MGNETDMSDGMNETAPDVYGIFCGGIDQTASQRFANFLTTIVNSQKRPKAIHVMFQSAGGFIGDGVFLYNLFKALPTELVLYNSGQLASAGVTAYLGARRRVTSPRATFMMHRSTNTPFGSADKLQKTAKNLDIDDARTEAILRDHIKDMSEELWSEMRLHDLYLSGEDAMKYGIATELGDFAPPVGTPVFNLPSLNP